MVDIARIINTETGESFVLSTKTEQTNTPERKDFATELKRRALVSGQHKAADYVHPHLNTNTES